MDGNPAFTVHVTRDATFDVTTSDVMFSEMFVMFEVYAMNLMLKTVFIKMSGKIFLFLLCFGDIQ